MSASVLMIFSHRVRESKTVFISGLHAVDSGFQSLVGSISQILEFGFLTSQTCLHTLMQTRLSANHSVGTIFRNTSWNQVAKALYLDKALAWENCYWLDEASFWQIRSTTQISWTYVSMTIWKQGFLLYTITPCSYNRPLMMTSFYYYDQNPSWFCFLVQIRAFVYLSFAEITKFKNERKNKKDCGRSSKMIPSWKWLLNCDLIRLSVTSVI